MKTISTILFVAFLFGACNNVPEPTPINLDLKSEALVKADNEFGLDLFQNIHKKESGNYNISPLSISLALAMTYNGAEGETKEAMQEAMRLTGLSNSEINESYKMLIEALMGADDKVELGVAQSIWYRLGYNVLDDFININQNYYEAEVNELDFSRDDAKDIMNGWIEDKTNDKIKNMIARVDPNHVMFLINAIYFKGTWQTEFNKNETAVRPFFVDENETVDVEMMIRTDSVMMASNDIMKAIELPYGKGNYNMVLMLPSGEMDDLVDELTPENWSAWMNEFEMKEEVEIWLPKFKDEYKIKLNDILSDMGMEIAFDPSADFSGINGAGGIWIDYVQHNTFIDVNEEGTEAAAATVVAMIERAMPENQLFHANRPFLYAITEKETGAILFIGKVVKPEYED